MRKFVLAALLLVSFPFTQRPTEVQAATTYGKLHVNWYTRYDYVEVNDLSKPIYRTSAPTPILRDKYENKIVGYEQLWDYEYVPRYESRAVSYVAGYENRPVYQARSETYVAYYDEYPIIATRQESYLVGYTHERVVIGYEPSYSTRQVCTFRWRGSCREWGTETYVSAQRPVYGTRSTPVYGTRTVSYVAGMGRRPVYATRTVQVLVGYERVPVYATRMETVLVGTSKVRVPGGRKPIYEWVKVCSACEIEGYSPPVKVLVGYQKKTVTQPVGETEVPCPGWGDCSDKNPIFVKGAWHEFSRHEDQCRVGGNINGARVANSLCEGGRVGVTGTGSVPCKDRTPPQETAWDGSCYTPQPEERVCRNGSVVTIKTSEQLSTDTAESPCPLPPDTEQVCRDGQVVTIPVGTRRSTDTASSPCPLPPSPPDTEQVCRDGQVVTIPVGTRRSTDTASSPCPLPPSPPTTVRVRPS